jgi:inward rectifier potassium channel
MHLPGWEQRADRRRAFGARADRLSVERLGYRSHWFDDFYHFVLRSPWWALLCLFVGGFVAVNLLFAEAYLWVPGSISGAREGSLADAFFFSVQTISTVGYGALLPQGTYANALAALEAFMGLIGFATVAGLVFARLSRPTARVVFSQSAVMGRFDGRPALLVRMGNARNNQVFDVRVQVSLLRDVVLADGEEMRRFFDLPLARDRTPVFTLTWLAIHFIDESSPLHGMDRAELERVDARILISLNGLDETFAQPIHARRVYRPEEIAWDARFVDVLDVNERGQTRVDFRRFHDTEPLRPDTKAPAPAGRG